MAASAVSRRVMLLLVLMTREATVPHGHIAVRRMARFAVYVSRLIVEPLRGGRVTGRAFTLLLFVVGIVAVQAWCV